MSKPASVGFFLLISQSGKCLKIGAIQEVITHPS
jgi:hypothetical protein